MSRISNDYNIEHEVLKAMRFICNGPSFTTTVKKSEVDFWLQNYSDTVFVRGELRQVVFTPITDVTYKVKTEEL